MKIVTKENVVNQIDQLLSTLDLLEMNVALRVNHAIKHKEDDVLDNVEIIHAHVAHMEVKMTRHLEEGNWMQSTLFPETLVVI